MNHATKLSNYNRYPVIQVQGGNHLALSGWNKIAQELKACTQHNKKSVIVIDCYPGVRYDELLNGLSTVQFENTICSDDCAVSGQELDALLEDTLTDDRVFGVMTTKFLSDYFINEKLEAARKKIDAVKKGVVLVYGVGATLITEGDILIYADLSRWEIQLRYRAGMSNWHTHNEKAEILSKYKRGFFAEWRWADKHKKTLFDRIDYFLDTNKAKKPVLVSGEGVRQALRQAAKQPFRTVPYFDPGVWGGQWMKRVCGLDQDAPNFAWSFDGVPEENSLLLQFGETVLELPAMNLVLYCPRHLLGDRVHARFGTEFPIRFDLLDTMGGQNLSLQVHPLTEYIQEQFNMRYTQDESYYILDAEDDACVYLGVKTNVDKDAMLSDLERAQHGECDFPAEKYVNSFPIKKHDHVLIPAGTVHCSGTGTMVLEVSATPYIFTFKLWDWSRLGLDGKPRPVHLKHGAANIQWERDTEWVQKHLLHQEVVLDEKEGIKTEYTGLHEREFLETHRFTFDRPMQVPDNGSVRMLNLVEGEQVVITSLDNAFAPFQVHYAETFILPEAAKRCIITPDGPSQGKSVKVLMAYVRG